MKILLIQLKQLGDVLMTTPATHVIRKHFPEAHITFMAQGSCAEVYNNNPDIDRIWKIPGKLTLNHRLGLLRKVREERFDLVVDFMGNPTTALITLVSRAKVRVGFNIRFRGRVYTHKGEISPYSSYSACDKLHLLRTLNIDYNQENTPILRFFPSDKDREFVDNLWKRLNIREDDFVITCSPVSRRAYKVWHPEYFAIVNDFLIKKYNAKILFLWGPGEDHFVRDVMKIMKEPYLPFYALPTIGQIGAIFERAGLHIGNDNGIRHIAIAMNVPTIGIFGKVSAKNWTPYKLDIPHISMEYNLDCKTNCTYPKCKLECLGSITPLQVISEIEKVIRDRDFYKRR